MYYVIYAKKDENDNYIFDNACEVVIFNSYTTEKGLCYVFEADSNEEANEKATEFIKEYNKSEV